MTETMLVRTTDGGWEELRPQTKAPAGGLIELFGEDIGPVMGASQPVLVVACEPALPTGSPDALCVDGEGRVTVLSMSLGPARDDTLAQLLAHAGSLHGMDYGQFAGMCNRALDHPDGLTGFVGERCGAGFHAGTFEVTVADALNHGRFQLAAMVGSAPPTLVHSVRYLNASGTDFSLYATRAFASDSVSAIQATAIDVGHVQREVVVSEMTAAGMTALTERTCDELTGRLMGQLQTFCAGAFDSVAYDGDAHAARFVASMEHGGASAEVMTAASDGAIVLSFEALAAFDKGWSVRGSLCQAMSRLLGAELGDVKKISQLNLNIREHLMDATLMEAFAEILSDTLATARATAPASRSGRTAVAA